MANTLRRFAQEAGLVKDDVFANVRGLQEAMAAMASSSYAVPASGLAGLYSAATGGNAPNAINKTQEFLSYKPESAQGQMYSNAIARLFAPAAEIATDAKQRLGDHAYGKTGSPLIATAAQITPELLAAYFGVRKMATPTAAAAPLNTGAFRGQRGAAGIDEPDHPYAAWEKISDDIYDDEGDVIGTDDYSLITKVYTPPNMRGKGIGRAKVKEAVEEAMRENPGKPVRLAAYPFGKDAMDVDDLVTWYETLGFDVIPGGGHAVTMQHDGNMAKLSGKK